MTEKAKVLYIDDETLNRRIFEFNFRDFFEIQFAEDGKDGLDKLKEFSDVTHIISDFRMPKMSGLEFIKEAKVLYPDKLFYLLSGFDITAEIREAIDNQTIAKYFQKPYNREDIKSTILSQ